MKNTDVKYLILLVLLAGIVLVAPSIIRMVMGNPYIASSEAYYNMRIYSQGSNYDSLQGHNVPFNIVNLLRIGPKSSDILFKIIPIILGIATIIFAYLALLRHNIPKNTVIAIIILLIVSPIFNYVFTDYKPYSFAIFLGMLGIYLLSREKSSYSSIAFALIPFIDILCGVMTLIMLALYIFASRKRQNAYKIASIALFSAVALAAIINIYYGYDISHTFMFAAHNVITDIGATIGISFSIIILSVIGLILLWEDGWRNLAAYIVLMILAAASVFNQAILIYLSFIIMIYAGFALIYLNKRKWSISIIKKTTVLLIICSIFFSTIVYSTKIIRNEPSKDYVDALEFVKAQSLPSEVILSDAGSGYIIEYYTERMAFNDDMTKYHDNKRYSEMDTILASRNLERTEKLFKDYNIKYVVIGKDFGPLLKETEGLQFLIDTSKKFTNIYKNDDVEVWMYIG